MCLGDLGDQRNFLLLGTCVYTVGLVDADARTVRRDDGYLETVELAQLVTDLHRRTGHAAHGRIQPDECLYGDRPEDLSFVRRDKALLRFDRGLQPVRPTPT